MTSQLIMQSSVVRLPDLPGTGDWSAALKASPIPTDKFWDLKFRPDERVCLYSCSSEPIGDGGECFFARIVCDVRRRKLPSDRLAQHGHCEYADYANAYTTHANQSTRYSGPL